MRPLFPNLDERLGRYNVTNENESRHFQRNGDPSNDRFEEKKERGSTQSCESSTTVTLSSIIIQRSRSSMFPFRHFLHFRPSPFKSCAFQPAKRTLWWRPKPQVPTIYKPRKESWITPTMVVVGIIPFFTFALGTWQLKRLKWKIGLIDELEEKLQLAPLTLPGKIKYVLAVNS